MRYGFLSTYTPTECGLATFTAALTGELRAGPPAGHIGVVRVVDRLERSARTEIVHHLVTSSPGGEAEAAAILDGFDAVVVQHEYGICGGPDGDQVLDVLERLTVPVIVVLHTVLVDPTPHQREVLERVLATADAVVTMTPTARRRLLQGYSAIIVIADTNPNGSVDSLYEQLAGRAHMHDDIGDDFRRQELGGLDHGGLNLGRLQDGTNKVPGHARGRSIGSQHRGSADGFVTNL